MTHDTKKNLINLVINQYMLYNIENFNDHYLNPD